jgi:hypothetical protein
MQISPKAAIVLKFVLTLANAVANGSLALTGIVTPQQATAIALGCQFFVTAVGLLTSAFSSSAPGPLAPADPPVVVAATRVAELPATASPVSVEIAKATATRAIVDHQP